MRRFYLHVAVLLLLFPALAVGAYLLFSGKQSVGQASPVSAAKEAPEAENRFDCLKGRWVRPDGGYVLEINEIGSVGKMTAKYFNPLPVNVSRAEAAAEGSTIKVFIELRDVNYPGATYHLTYDADNDQLRGVYFQLVLQQGFHILFNRGN